jgi:hypothetical protein
MSENVLKQIKIASFDYMDQQIASSENAQFQQDQHHHNKNLN